MARETSPRRGREAVPEIPTQSRFARDSGTASRPLSERALLGHARASGELAWSWADLAEDVQVAVLAAGERAYGENLLRLHCQRFGCIGDLSLLVGVALALPGDEDAVFLQEGGGELGEGREAADGAGGDRRVALAALASGQLLGAGVEDAGIGDPGELDRALDELALAADRLDQIDLRTGQDYSEYQARKTSSRADIGDRAGLAEGRGLEAGEAVGDVHLPGASGVGDRADRGALLGEQPQHDLEGLASLRIEACRRIGAHSVTSGATTTQRRGSSPSLKVSTPARSLRCSWTTRRSWALIGSISTSRPPSSACSAARSARAVSVSLRRSR